MTHKLLRLACACLCAAACALSADAQESANPRTRTRDAIGRQTPSPASPAPSASSASPASSASSASSAAEADEDFDLDIAERRITEENYQASLSVALDAQGQRGLDVRVGVAVSAASIDVLLRNVRGRVRFRATLGQLLRLLDERRAGGPGHLAAPHAPSSP